MFLTCQLILLLIRQRLNRRKLPSSRSIIIEDLKFTEKISFSKIFHSNDVQIKPTLLIQNPDISKNLKRTYLYNNNKISIILEGFSESNSFHHFSSVLSSNSICSYCRIFLFMLSIWDISILLVACSIRPI